MKAILFTTVTIIAIAVTGVAAKLKQPQTVTVRINSEAPVPKTNLKVAFTELVEDARCPEDTTCVWAGNAKIKVRVTANGRTEVLELDTTPRAKVPVKFGQYTLKLVKLTPVPRTNIRINRNGYEATIEVFKSGK